MKAYSILFLIFLTSFAKKSNAQCEVDAGENVHLCLDWGNFDNERDSANLNPQIISGTPPFNYSWESKVHLWDDKFLTASDFLSDTTAANPGVFKDFHPWNELVNFKLTVTDSVGNICHDSLKISISNYAMLLVDIGEFINQGDSVQFGWFRVGGGVGSLSVDWTPNYNISDTSSFAPVLWPDTSLTYQMLIYDSVGCSMIDKLPVKVLTVGTEDIFTGAEHFKTYPNPNKGIFFFEKTDKSPINGTIELLDLSGKIIFSKKMKNQIRGKVDLPNLASGNYFIRLFEKEKIFVGQVKIE